MTAPRSLTRSLTSQVEHKIVPSKASIDDMSEADCDQIFHQAMELLCTQKLDLKTEAERETAGNLTYIRMYDKIRKADRA